MGVFPMWKVVCAYVSYLESSRYVCLFPMWRVVRTYVSYRKDMYVYVCFLCGG